MALLAIREKKQRSKKKGKKPNFGDYLIFGGNPAKEWFLDGNIGVLWQTYC